MADKHLRSWQRATDTEGYPHALNSVNTYLPTDGGKRLQLQMRPPIETLRVRDVESRIRPLRKR